MKTPHQSRRPTPGERIFGVSASDGAWLRSGLVTTMRTLLFILVTGALLGCQSTPKPSLALKDARLAEGPVLVKRGEHFYLRYRRALDDSGFPLRLVLVAKKTDRAGYYYFSGPISHPEWGNLVERPLAMDGLEELARSRSIYWLDPDGTKHTVPVRSYEPRAPGSLE